MASTMKDSARKILELRKRWDIPFDEKDALRDLKNRVVGIAKRFDHHNDLSLRFATLRGLEVCWGSAGDRSRDRFHDSYGARVLRECADISEVALALQCLYHACEEENKAEASKFIAAVEEAVELSPGAGIRVAVRDGSVTFYPGGAELLDEGTVNDVLQWLGGYPEASKSFKAALQFYMQGSPEKHRNLLDNLRLSLEMLIRQVLKNEKSLESQKPILLAWLKGRGLHQQVINMFDSLLSQYAAYQNDAVKHGEKYGGDEIEFMIYQTGTFMRLILRLADKQ